MKIDPDILFIRVYLFFQCCFCSYLSCANKCIEVEAYILINQDTSVGFFALKNAFCFFSDFEGKLSDHFLIFELFSSDFQVLHVATLKAIENCALVSIRRSFFCRTVVTYYF
jgi:hypothetical protein